MQPDLTANTSAGSTNSGVGLLFPEYTYPGSSNSNNKENLPLTPGNFSKFFSILFRFHFLFIESVQNLDSTQHRVGIMSKQSSVLDFFLEKDDDDANVLNDS